MRAADNKVMLKYNRSGSKLTGVEDVLGRKTSYEYETEGISKITYPGGKISSYDYDRFKEIFYEGEEYEKKIYTYYIKSQEVKIKEDSEEKLVRRNEFEYDFRSRKSRKINSITVKKYNEDNKLQQTVVNYSDDDDHDMLTKTYIKNNEKVVISKYFEYDINKNTSSKSVYEGEDEKEFHRLGIANGGQESFYNNDSVNNNIYKLPSAVINIRKYNDENGDRVDIEAQEEYYQYDADGNLLETKTLKVEENDIFNWIITEYKDYDQYGNCRQKIFDAGGQDPINIYYEYSPEYNGAYLSSMTQYISKNLIDNNCNFIGGRAVTTEYQYDFKTGNKIKVIDPAGNSISYEYDNLGRATKVIYPKIEGENESAYEEVVYEDENNLVKVYDAERKNLSIHYFDGLGREVKTEKYKDLEGTELHSSTESRYNWLDKVKTSTDQNGKVTTSTYDFLGRKTAVETDDGKKTTIEYKTTDNPRGAGLVWQLTTTNPEGIKSVVINNQNGQKIITKEMEDRDANTYITRKYFYDGYENMVKFIDGKGNQKGYQYNNLGQNTAVKYPDHLGQIYENNHPADSTVKNYYNSKGQLAKTVNRNQQTIYYNYNEYGQTINVDLPQSADINYYYNQLGQLKKVVKGEYERTYNYDNLGREINSKQSLDIGNNQIEKHELEYNYNKNNQLIEMSYPDNSNLELSYNNLNQIVSVNWKGSPLISHVQYNLTGHIDNMIYGNGKVNNYDYTYINGQYLPDHINYGTSVRFDYSYDSLGRITRINDQSYNYDDRGQLSNWQYFQDNEQVLLGEELIWEKVMEDNTGLDMNGTMVHDDNLQLAVETEQDLFDVMELVDDEQIESKTNLKKTEIKGYEIYRESFTYTEEFKDFADVQKTNIILEDSEVVLQENQGEARWKAIVEDHDRYTLEKNNYEKASVNMGSISPDTKYSGYEYRESESFRPPVNSGHWKRFGTLTLNDFEDITQIEFKMRARLKNSWILFGGWGNWNLFIKLEMNGECLGIQKFKTGCYYDQTQTKYMTVDLKDKDLVNTNNKVQCYYLVSKWGVGNTDGGNIRSISATGVERQYYPVDEARRVSYSIGMLTGEQKLKVEADTEIPNNTSIEYKLDEVLSLQSLVNLLFGDSSERISKDISPDETFVVNKNNRFNVIAYLKSQNKNITPAVNELKVSREKKYPDMGLLETKAINLPDKADNFEIKPEIEIPEGTGVKYHIFLYKDDGTYTTKEANYDSEKERYTAEFSYSGEKIKIGVELLSDRLNKYTPVLKSLEIHAPDTGDYKAEGEIVTREIEVSEEMAESIIMELYGRDNNSDDVDIELMVDGKIVAGEEKTVDEVLTSIPSLSDIEAIVPDQDTELEDGILRPTIVSSSPYSLKEQAAILRDYTNDKELETKYYRFDLPEDINYPANLKFKFTLKSGNNLKQSPNVYGFLLFDNYLRYVESGKFLTSNSIKSQGYTFDKLRLDVEQIINDGTDISYELSGYGSGVKTISSGVNTSLPVETDNIKVGGQLSSNNNTISPEITEMSLTAVGEKPFNNDLETLDDVNTDFTGTLSLSSDRAVGSKAVLIDHSSQGYGEYIIENETTFDAEKLPVVKLWVKPLTAGHLSFKIYNTETENYEFITSDSDGDSYYETGKDLKQNSWNLLLLDLRKTSSGGLTGDAGSLKVVVRDLGTKVLIDGISSLPLNEVSYAYDEAGNRISRTVNGMETTYEYSPGKNLLERRYSAREEYQYQYDNEGNLIYQRVTDRITGDVISYDYSYNELNQLKEVYKDSELIAEYSYDHSGLRYKKADYITGETTIYVYGQGTEPVYEEVYNNNNLETADKKCSYLFMGSKRIARDEDGSLTYYYTDHLGSTRAVQSGSDITRLDYAPFGEDLSPNSERFKFTGKEDDQSTGLYYFNARYYDPGAGRFITEDPAKDGENWYQFCRNNPLRYVDPSGENAKDISRVGKEAYNAYELYSDLNDANRDLINYEYTVTINSLITYKKTDSYLKDVNDIIRDVPKKMTFEYAKKYAGKSTFRKYIQYDVSSDDLEKLHDNIDKKHFNTDIMYAKEYARDLFVLGASAEAGRLANNHLIGILDKVLPMSDSIYERNKKIIEKRGYDPYGHNEDS